MKTAVFLVALACVVAVATAVSPLERMRFRAAPATKGGAVQPPPAAKPQIKKEEAPAADTKAPTESKPPAKDAPAKADAKAPAPADAKKADAKPADAKKPEVNAEAAKAAKTIVNNAQEKANEIQKTADPKSAADAKKSADSYLPVTNPEAEESKVDVAVKSLGLSKKLSVDPKVLGHAKRVDSELVGNHRAFVNQHAKDCKGTLCPFAAEAGKVEAEEKF
uniref:Uncharacterized protein n=1 Tax=Coccolithus braarudii TaxID=221442 RepID=A0A7S0LGV6_9EUKA|mmetsp:Transcript_39832/g.84923  ORF Transcript_39832/g.84923 Transcript_39832/m.84923 type:complete len:221 (+) Transcript_39832:58-720(+)|eukprot:CAMPEP_0183345404 /NCGR_PEP_ID=MMETSP0164_2-20130417/10842_1 /TAXON_ID=221442 /ORGANISM="Coccolithus pelagicus ssp braarudi, Strain PLY182g" /LENGTH=220 /DNA_ID=CAMNT_0025516541 /DNA_START=48 /DNA_END=710 /DNA_ORIENTATION=-